MKAGFVTLFGRSNVGKSTLLNALVGSKIAMTTPKPQTTRGHIQGVVHAPEGQIVFVDTPGLFTSSRDRLTRALNRHAETALTGVNVIAHVVDPTRPIGPEDKRIFALLASLPTPKVMVINKIDMRGAPYAEAFRALAEGYAGVVEVSAKQGTHLKSLVAMLLELLPDGEAIYETGQLTNVSSDEWYAELIREKLFLRLHDELPYTLTVHVRESAVRPDGTLYIAADIVTTDERYRCIIIGAGGRGIKEIGQSARRELEGATGGKVYLDLQVVVDPHWTAAFE